MFTIWETTLFSSSFMVKSDPSPQTLWSAMWFIFMSVKAIVNYQADLVEVIMTSRGDLVHQGLNVEKCFKSTMHFDLLQKNSTDLNHFSLNPKLNQNRSREFSRTQTREVTIRRDGRFSWTYSSDHSIRPWHQDIHLTMFKILLICLAKITLCT